MARGRRRSRFTDRLRKLADPLWEAQHRHPFVQGIGRGDLSMVRFRAWVRQDYLFLMDYARLLSLAAARAPDVDTMARMADLAQATLRSDRSPYLHAAGIPASNGVHKHLSPIPRRQGRVLIRVPVLP